MLYQCNEISAAIQKLKEQFPFNNYLAEDDGKHGPYSNIAATVKKYLPVGSRILDFGAGPCDKTAVLQLLGYQCSACDDLQDDWHKLPGNREKIKAFTSGLNINFTLIENQNLQYEKSEFDMIMLHDVLEHLHSSPRELLLLLLQFLKEDGLLFITVPNAVNIRKRLDVLRGRTNLPDYGGYYWYPGEWRGHIREYVHGDLVLLTKFLGLQLISVHGCDHMLAKVPLFLRSLYLKITDVFDGLKDSWLLIARKPANWVPRMKLSNEEATQILGKNSYTPQEP